MPSTLPGTGLIALGAALHGPGLVPGPVRTEMAGIGAVTALSPATLAAEAALLGR